MRDSIDACSLLLQYHSEQNNEPKCIIKEYELSHSCVCVCVSNMCLSICLSVGGITVYVCVCDNKPKEYMQVDDDAKCMWTNFGGGGLFGFRDFAPFCLPSKNS